MSTKRGKARKAERVTLATATKRARKGERVKIPGANGRAVAWVVSNADMRLIEQLEDAQDARDADEILRVAKAKDFEPWEVVKARLRL